MYQSPLLIVCSITKRIFAAGLADYSCFPTIFVQILQNPHSGTDFFLFQILRFLSIAHKKGPIFRQFVRMRFCIIVYINQEVILSTESFKHFPQSFPQRYFPCLQQVEPVFNRQWKTLEPKFCPFETRRFC